MYVFERMRMHLLYGFDHILELINYKDIVYAECL